MGHDTQASFDGQGFVWHGEAVKVGDAARIRRGQTQAHAQGGGFASAIGANHTQTLPGRDVEGQIVHHLVVAKAFVQMLDIQ